MIAYYTVVKLSKNIKETQIINYKKKRAEVHFSHTSFHYYKRFTMSTTNTPPSTYPKPPYDDCEETWHFFDTPMQSCAFRAMEREGQVFKSITHKVQGLKYLYWHPEKNGVELWHKTGNVGAWANAIRMLDDRFVYACLRSKLAGCPVAVESGDTGEQNATDTQDSDTHIASEDSDYDIVSNAMADADTNDGEEGEEGDEGDTDAMETDVDLSTGAETQEDTVRQAQWAQAKLHAFKENAKYKMLFDIPDFTGFAPAWQMSPAIIATMDSVLTTYHLSQSETLLYDKRSCELMWLRRDCSSYEIRTNNHYALEYAQRFILQQLYTILTTWNLAPNTIPANSMLWANVYSYQQTQQRAVSAQKRAQRRSNRKNRPKHHNQHQQHRHHDFQARKNKKRQMLRSATPDTTA